MIDEGWGQGHEDTHTHTRLNSGSARSIEARARGEEGALLSRNPVIQFSIEPPAVWSRRERGRESTAHPCWETLKEEKKAGAHGREKGELKETYKYRHGLGSNVQLKVIDECINHHQHIMVDNTHNCTHYNCNPTCGMMKHQRTILDTSNGTLTSFRSALFSYSMTYQYKCPVQLIGRSVCTRPQTRYPAELPRSWREERDEKRDGEKTAFHLKLFSIC